MYSHASSNPVSRTFSRSFTPINLLHSRKPREPCIKRILSSQSQNSEDSVPALNTETKTSSVGNNAKLDNDTPVFSFALNEGFAADELMEELKDKKHVGKRGEVLLMIQIVTVFLVMFPPMQLKGVVYFAGVLSLIFGLLVCVYAVFNLGKSFSPLVAPRASNKVITTGLYQYMRHPIYSGLILFSFGLSATLYDETRLMLSCLLTLILRYKAQKEEEALLEKHGEEYRDYMMKVARFIPTL